MGLSVEIGGQQVTAMAGLQHLLHSAQGAVRIFFLTLNLLSNGVPPVSGEREIMVIES